MFIEKLSKMVPESENCENLLLLGQKSIRDNKGSDSEVTTIFETKHPLWLDTSWNFREGNNQNLGKNLLAEKNLLADQRQC